MLFTEDPLRVTNAFDDPDKVNLKKFPPETFICLYGATLHDTISHSAIQFLGNMGVGKTTTANNITSMSDGRFKLVREDRTIFNRKKRVIVSDTGDFPDLPISKIVEMRSKSGGLRHSGLTMSLQYCIEQLGLRPIQFLRDELEFNRSALKLLDILTSEK